MKLVNYNRPFPASAFRFFDDHRTQASAGYRPAVNIVENDDQFELELLAPGRVKEHFNIAFNEGTLEIAYVTPEQEETTEVNYRRREFRLPDFTRRFKLDAKVIDDEAIAADYVNGVLTLTLPKREEAQPKAPRQIAIA